MQSLVVKRLVPNFPVFADYKQLPSDLYTPLYNQRDPSPPPFIDMELGNICRAFPKVTFLKVDRGRIESLSGGEFLTVMSAMKHLRHLEVEVESGFLSLDLSCYYPHLASLSLGRVCLLLKGTGTRDLIFLKVVSLERS